MSHTPKSDLKISIIIPAYMRDELLKDCLESIKRSTCTDYEVIVVDDCSPEPFPGLVEGCGFTYLRHERNKGAGAARNTGAARAKGDVLLFVDSDIELYPDTIQKIADEFNREPRTSALTALISRENRFKNYFSRYKTAFFRWSAINMKSEVAYVCTSCAAIRKAAFDDAGGFSENYEGASWEDVEIGLSIVRRGGVIKFNKSIEVIHNKKLGFLEIIRNDYKRTRDFVVLIIRKRKEFRDLRKQGLYVANADRGAAMALAACGAMLLVLALRTAAAATAHDIPRIASSNHLLAILSIIYLAGSYRFLRVCQEVSGFWFMASAAFVSFFLNAIYCFGVLAGLIKHFGNR